MKQLLLLLSGLEENPGPAQANVDAEKCDIEEWEMNEVPEEDVVIQNRRTKCAVCGVGDLKLDNKVQMMVYSRSGMKRVTHQVRRCNNRNPACRALHGQGYHHEKKHRIYENYALKNDILVTGVSINSKNGVFYKSSYLRFEFLLGMQN